LLAEPFRQMMGDQPRHHVGRAAGREWHDDAHRMGRIWLGRGDAGHEQRRGQYGQADHWGHGSPLFRARGSAQSILILACSITWAHLALSLLMLAPNSAGVSATAVKPSVSSFSFTSGSETSFLISALSRATSASGVPAGTTMPVSVSPSWPGM